MIYSAPVCASLVDAATSLKRGVVLFYLSFTIFCAFEKFRLPTMSYIKPSSTDGVTPTMNCTSGLYEVSREHLSFRKRLSALRLADSRVLLLVFVRYVLVFFCLFCSEQVADCRWAPTPLLKLAFVSCTPVHVTSVRGGGASGKFSVIVMTRWADWLTSLWPWSINPSHPRSSANAEICLPLIPTLCFVPPLFKHGLRAAV